MLCDLPKHANMEGQSLTIRQKTPGLEQGPQMAPLHWTRKQRNEIAK